MSSYQMYPLFVLVHDSPGRCKWINRIVAIILTGLSTAASTLQEQEYGSTYRRNCEHSRYNLQRCSTDKV